MTDGVSIPAWPEGGAAHPAIAPPAAPEQARTIGAGVIASGLAMCVSPWLAWYPGVSGFGLSTAGQLTNVAPASNWVVMAFDEDGWYNSFLGPVVPIVFGAAIVLLGGRIAAGRPGGRPALALLLAAWLAALDTGSSGSYFAGGLGGPGLTLWASTAAVGFALIAVATKREATRLRSPSWRAGGITEGLGALVLVLAFVPCNILRFQLEDTYPFDAVGVGIALAAAIGLPSVGLATALVAMRPAGRTWRRAVPAGIALLLGMALFGLYVDAALTNP